MRIAEMCAAHLCLGKQVLAPGAEWAPEWAGWIIASISEGSGYCLRKEMNCQLEPSAVLLAADRTRISFRASMVNGCVLRYFVVTPERLTGLLSLEDQNVLEAAARDPQRSFRVLSPGDRGVEEIGRFFVLNPAASLQSRLDLLRAFLAIFGESFVAPTPEVLTSDARGRLRQTLRETPLANLVDLGVTDLAQRTGCSPRHLSRLFTEMVGISFREKQTELRLKKARDLLARTNSKISEVALESGYQSMSLFSFTFKQHFGVSPAKWREQCRAGRIARQPRG